MHRNFLRISIPVLSGIFMVSAANAADLQVTGFGSAYYGQALTSNLLPYNFSSAKKVDFTDFSLFGLNFNSKIDDHWSAGAQLVGLGDKTTAANNAYSTFDVEVAYAAVTYKTDSGLALKAGRQRFPIFTASEFIYEHQELPFREMPAIVFQMAPFVAFDGVGLSQAIETGIGKVNVQLFGGTPVLAIVPPAGGTATLSNLAGARVNLEGDGWRVRAQASRSSSQSTVGTTNAYADSEYFSAGYRFDKYNIVSWGEYVVRYAPDGSMQSTATGPHRYLGLGRAGYALLGYKLGDWMPRYTFAQASADLGTVGEGKSTTHTIGVNYAASPKVTVKAEWELTVVPFGGGGYKTTQPGGTDATAGSAIYAGIDFEI